MFDLPDVLAQWERRIVELPPAVERGRAAFDALYPLPGLEEHTVWERVADSVAVGAQSPAHGVMQYVLTEMVNNAIDHSRGSRVHVTVTEDAASFEVVVADDGIGIFDNLRAHLDLPDAYSAVLELTKGKRTTDPDRHTGEGIFFSSRAAEVFGLAANGVEWIVDNRRGDEAVGSSVVEQGTVVRFVVPTHGGREIERVFAEFVDENNRFNRTRPSVKLAEMGTLFISRSEAKRLMQGLEKFEEVELDFAGVTRVGQGFADEVFRVWQRLHPHTRLIPVRMVEPVAFMVRRSADFPPRG